MSFHTKTRWVFQGTGINPMAVFPDGPKIDEIRDDCRLNFKFFPDNHCPELKFPWGVSGEYIITKYSAIGRLLGTWRCCDSFLIHRTLVGGDNEINFQLHYGELIVEPSPAWSDVKLARYECDANFWLYF